jgi:hypothetical protein
LQRTAGPYIGSNSEVQAGDREVGFASVNGRFLRAAASRHKLPVTIFAQGF